MTDPECMINQGSMNSVTSSQAEGFVQQNVAGIDRESSSKRNLDTVSNDQSDELVNKLTADITAALAADDDLLAADLRYDLECTLAERAALLSRHHVNEPSDTQASGLGGHKRSGPEGHGSHGTRQ